MIAFWNKREIYFGNSLLELNRVRGILSENNIKYIWNIVNQYYNNCVGSNLGRMGTFDEDNVSTFYYLYVHKKDYDKAFYLINKNDPSKSHDHK